MSKKIFAAFLALLMLLQIPAVVDALDDFGIETTAEAATYKLSKPAITKLTNVSGGIKVQWGKVKGASNYRLMYKTSSAGSWKKLLDTTATSYTFDDVTCGKTYYFTVRCVSKSGKSYTSAYDKTGEKIKYLDKPVITKLSSTSTGVKITWGEVKGAAKYRVMMQTLSGWKKVADTTSTSYTYKTQDSGEYYTFTVRCVSSTGKSYTSAYDPIGRSVTFIAKPEMRSIESTDNGLTLKWTKSPGTYKYRVLRKTSTGWKKITDTAKTGYTYKNAEPGKSYTFTVRCIDKKGNYISAYNTAGWKATYADPASAKRFIGTWDLYMISAPDMLIMADEVGLEFSLTFKADGTLSLHASADGESTEATVSWTVKDGNAITAFEGENLTFTLHSDGTLRWNDPTDPDSKLIFRRRT